MSVVRQTTFRLVGVVDVRAVIDELANSDPDDIAAFILAVLQDYEDKDFNRFLCEEIKELEFEEEEEEEDEEEF